MQSEAIAKKSNKTCVIIPTYNNAGTLAKVIEEVSMYTDAIIVVNDGSMDNTSEVIANYAFLHVVNYKKNVGKGWALRQGFEKALELGYDYAISIDSDGQHFAADIPVFIEKLDQNNNALIIGARNMDQDGIPQKSNFGKNFSNFWFWVETGIKSPDTQSGYRLYPIHLMKDMVFFTKKFEFEIEVIVRAAWKGIKIESVPVSVYYAPGKERITHFRPFKDFSRISVLNTVLVTLALFYYYPLIIFKKIFKITSWKDLKAQALNPEESALTKSASVALGVFMGIVPIWGFQMAAAILLAIFLKLNKVIVIISANISIPPLIPLIIFLSYQTGGLFLENTPTISYDSQLSLASIQSNFFQYIYGSIVFAVIAALFSGGLTFILLKLFKKPAYKAL